MRIEDLNTGDEFGNDPLKNKAFVALDGVTQYLQHTVTLEQTGNPALIAFDYYNEPDLDFIILAANGIPDGTSISAGQELLIPSPAQVFALFRQPKTRNSVKI